MDGRGEVQRIYSTKILALKKLKISIRIDNTSPSMRKLSIRDEFDVEVDVHISERIVNIHKFLEVSCSEIYRSGSDRQF